MKPIAFTMQKEKSFMWKCFIYLGFVMLFSVSCGSLAQQQQYTSHAVKKGETVYSISKQYNTSVETIYNLNPEVRNGLKLNSILIMPGSGSVKTISQKFKNHRVKRKETLYSIAQLYNISVEDIKKYNKKLYSRSLKKGEKLRIPIISRTAVVVNPDSSNAETINYIVQPKETKYGLARKYGITIAELERMNPTMGDSLKIGFSLVVPNKTVTESAVIEEEEDFEFYEVQPKEGFFRLKVKFGLSEEEIIALNPYAKDGLKVGMILKMPKVGFISTDQILSVNLEGAISDRKMKNIAVMLPFRLHRNISDTTQTDEDLLKIDPTLRVSLDFYSGVLMATEFAKDKGISVTLNVFDTEKSDTKVASIISNNNVKNMDAVIGPLLKKNVEKAAVMLKDSKTPVFSPLSNRDIKLYSNFFQTLPSQSYMEKNMLRYIKENSVGKNVIVISDSKTHKQKTAILAAIPTAKVITPRTGGYVQAKDVSAKMQKGIENWVILESSNSVLVSSAVSVLHDLLIDYEVRLFTTNRNSAYEYHEVSNMRLAKLNFTFPSVNKSVKTEERQPFLVSYKNKYGVAPNRYAIRGFDIAYDVLLRLASGGNIYEVTTAIEETEYIENKFRYIHAENGGYTNQAIYILKYNEDLNFEIVE